MKKDIVNKQSGGMDLYGRRQYAVKTTSPSSPLLLPHTCLSEIRLVMTISIVTRIGILPKTLQEYHFSNIKGLGLSRWRQWPVRSRTSLQSFIVSWSDRFPCVCVAGPSFDCENVVINNTAVKILLDDIEFWFKHVIYLLSSLSDIFIFFLKIWIKVFSLQ